MDPYKTLGVSKAATPEEIKKAYRKLAKQHHPDVNHGNKEAEEKFKEISLAYDMIQNPENHRKKEYSPPGNNVADAFKKWANAFRRAGINREQQQSYDIETSLSFKESCFGTQKKLSYTARVKCSGCDGIGAKEGDYETCKDCEGNGIRQSRHGFQITASVCASCAGRGQKIKVKCEACSGYGQTSVQKATTVTIPPCLTDKIIHQFRTSDGDDVCLILSIEEDSNFVRPEGSADIHGKVSISLKEALLGCKVPIRTIHGEKVVTIAECTQPGTKARLKGLGAKFPNGTDEYGNHIAHIEIQFPDKLTDEQKNAITLAFGENPSDAADVGEKDDKHQ